MHKQEALKNCKILLRLVWVAQNNLTSRKTVRDKLSYQMIIKLFSLETHSMGPHWWPRIYPLNVHSDAFYLKHFQLRRGIHPNFELSPYRVQDNKYSLLMHRIKIKSPANVFMEWIKRFCGWIYHFSISLTLVVLQRQKSLPDIGGTTT